MRGMDLLIKLMKKGSMKGMGLLIKNMGGRMKMSTKGTARLMERGTVAIMPICSQISGKGSLFLLS
ncbi:hypothetical protein [Methanosarcina sp. KYL-1]|uniref:hypothetical protein n=1 Tax=Methanosarcina sp. KYL-1 TaxID=2602068 RepID=UPI0021006A32|nr:hypothetical protein [Methanosarcina sp. KYL-1]